MSDTIRALLRERQESRPIDMIEQVDPQVLLSLYQALLGQSMTGQMAAQSSGQHQEPQMAPMIASVPQLDR